MNSRVLETARRHHQTGEWQPAVALYRQFLEGDPENAEVWCLLGEALQALSQREEAAASYRRSLCLHPDNAVASNNLGIVLLQLGKPEEAIAHYRQALVVQPNSPEVANNLGILLLDQGKGAEAVAAFRQALQWKPAYPEAWTNLGNALAQQCQGPQQGQCDFKAMRGEAADCYRQALVYAPDYAEAHNNLGIVLMDQGRLAEAVALVRQALFLQPQYPEALFNLGRTLAQQHKWAEAAASYQKAIALRPHFAEAHHNLGWALATLDRHDEALACYQQALQLKPHYAEALNNLASTYKAQGRLNEAIAHYRQAIAAKPEDAAMHSNLLFAYQYQAGHQPEFIFREHRAWAERHGDVPALYPQRRPARLLPGQRLRIGYVSPDICQHVMGLYLEAILQPHDRDRFEIFCYADVPHPDALTGRVQALADHWRSLVGLPDAAAADLIRQDDIDILVDLAGHTGGNRLRVFARKPAPIQVTHFGYLCTSGLQTIDYRLTDPHADPPGQTERYCAEKLVRLPETLWCYAPPPSPEVSALPARQAGHVTFGSFNNLCKVTDEMIGLWSQILKAVPRSRMLLLTGAGRGGDDRIREAFARQAIRRECLTLVDRQGHYDYFKLHHAVDLCLDTFPFTGCNTTADALWMGVPVVTLAGTTCATRQGVAALVHVGLQELVTETAPAYVDTATAWARDLARLSQIRSELRDRMLRSPLTDVPRFVRHLEECYLALWEQKAAEAITAT